MREPTPEVPHHRQRERHQAARDAAGLHQPPGQDEERDRQQHKIVRPGDEPLGEH